jgi:IS30 family transposase
MHVGAGVSEARWFPVVVATSCVSWEFVMAGRVVRVWFWELVRAGYAAKPAAQLVGVSHETGLRWFREAGGVIGNAPRLLGERYLSLVEREEISRGLTEEWVQTRLVKRWSPTQIAATAKQEYPNQPERWVSHETTYQAIYVQGRGALRRELAACLRTGRALHRPRKQAAARRPRIPNIVEISERPAEAEERAVPGHWEGDLIMGGGNKSAIGTLVERSTRFVMLLHVPNGYDALQVRDAMIATIHTLPAQLRRSLTWDRGNEMARHADITLATDMAIYFCDPHSPWQRGSNENTNGLLRQYFPKDTDLTVHSPAHLTAVAAELNERPRQTLGWISPAQSLNRVLSGQPPIATTG